MQFHHGAVRLREVVVLARLAKPHIRGFTCCDVPPDRQGMCQPIGFGGVQKRVSTPYVEHQQWIVVFPVWMLVRVDRDFTAQHDYFSSDVVGDVLDHPGCDADRPPVPIFEGGFPVLHGWRVAALYRVLVMNRLHGVSSKHKTLGKELEESSEPRLVGQLWKHPQTFGEWFGQLFTDKDTSLTFVEFPNF